MARQNLLLWSRDFSQSEWEQVDTVVLNDAIGVRGDLGAAKISEATAGENFCIQDITRSVAVNDEFHFGVSLKLTGSLEGDGRIDIRIEQDGAGTPEGTTFSVTATSTLTEYQVSHTFANIQTGIRIRIINVASGVDEIHADAPHVNIGSMLDMHIETTTTPQNRYFEETFQDSNNPQAGYDNAGWSETGDVNPNASTIDVKNPLNWREKSLTRRGITTTDSIDRVTTSKTTQNGRLEFVVESGGITELSAMTFLEIRETDNNILLQAILDTDRSLNVVVRETSTGIVTLNLPVLNLLQRYRLEWLYDIAGDAYEIFLGGVSQGSGTLSGTPPTDILDVTLTAGIAGNTSRIYFNLLALDDTARVWNETEDIGPDGSGPTGRTRGTHEVVEIYGDAASFTVDYDDGQLGIWESATENDLVSDDESRILEVRADKSSYGDGVVMIGSAVDQHRFRNVRALHGHGHDGTPNMGVRFNPTGDGAPWFLGEDYAQFTDIVLNHVFSSASTRQTFFTNTAFTGMKVINCIDVDSVNNGAGVSQSFRTQGATSFIILCQSINSQDIGFTHLAGIVFYYACNVANAGSTGFLRTSGMATAKNCMAIGPNSNWGGTFDAASTNNSSQDGLHPGGSGQTGVPLFRDIGNNDLHLNPNDVLLIDNGVDLRADLNFPFRYDIDNELITIVPIGADAVSPASGGSGRLLLLFDREC